MYGSVKDTITGVYSAATSDKVNAIVEVPTSKEDNCISNECRNQETTTLTTTKQEENMNDNIVTNRHIEDIEVNTNKDGTDPALLRLMYIRNIPPPLTSEDVEGDRVYYFKDPGFVSSCSLSESKMRKISKTSQGASLLNSCTKNHIVRVFPDGRRISSSNYNPIPAWLCGCQVAALNYQRFGWKVWLNEGMFRLNGKSGYILKPPQLLKAASTGIQKSQNELLPLGENNDNSNSGSRMKVTAMIRQYSGIEYISKKSVQPWSLKPESFKRKTLMVTIISGHYLPRTIRAEKTNKKQVINPYVEVSLHGLMQKEGEFFKANRTSWVHRNGFNPTWNETFVFDVLYTDLSLLSFIVRSRESRSGAKNSGEFVGQQVIPVSALRCGYRVVPLNFYNGAPMDGALLFCRFYWR